MHRFVVQTLHWLSLKSFFQFPFRNFFRLTAFRREQKNMPKIKIPRADALALVDELMSATGNNLDSFCERWIIAGSIRREKAFVGDIEIVYISRMVPKKAALTGQQDFGFLPPEVSAMKEEIDALIENGILKKRIFEQGQTMYGPRLQFVRHVGTGIPIDFFACSAEGWWTTLVSRTGGEASNKELARRAQVLGYTWNPGGRGFTSLSDETIIFPVNSEEDAFRFVGMPYLRPELRA